MNFLKIPGLVSRKSSMNSDLSGIPSEIVIESRIVYGKKRHAFYGLFMDYSRNTSIHGMHYFFQRKRSLWERLFWIICFIVALVYCTFSVGKVYDRWKNFPIIISFDTKAIPIYEIPFPSIVICPQIKTNSWAFNFTDVYQRAQMENATTEELDFLSALLHVCSPPDVQKVIEILEKYDFNNTDIEEKLFSVMVDLIDTGIVCVWYGRFYSCPDLQRYAATDEGICYQFNGVDSSNLYREQR